jgi:hypothetical protein
MANTSVSQSKILHDTRREVEMLTTRCNDSYSNSILFTRGSNCRCRSVIFTSDSSFFDNMNGWRHTVQGYLLCHSNRFWIGGGCWLWRVAAERWWRSDDTGERERMCGAVERNWLRVKRPRVDGSYPCGVKDKIPRIFLSSLWDSVSLWTVRNDEPTWNSPKSPRSEDKDWILTDKQIKARSLKE